MGSKDDNQDESHRTSKVCWLRQSLMEVMGESRVHFNRRPWRSQAQSVVASPAPKYVMEIGIVGQCAALALPGVWDKKNDGDRTGPEGTAPHTRK